VLFLTVVANNICMWLEAFLPPLSLSSKTLLVCGGDASFLLLTAYIVQLVGKHGKVIEMFLLRYNVEQKWAFIFPFSQSLF